MLALLAAALVGLSACGSSEGPDNPPIEGEIVDLGELAYNVQITRFLNPAAVEDSTYLQGVDAPPKGEDYLGVFLDIKNEGDAAERVPLSFKIHDSADTTFTTVPVDNEFSLPLGQEIPPEGQIPVIDSAAASGPIKGGMLLFSIPEAAIEDRPFELQIMGPDGQMGIVELDL